MKYIIFTLVCLFSLSLTAQQAEVAISYEIEQINQDEAQMHLYLQSLRDQERTVRAINFSLALPAGCVEITGQQSIFSEAWTEHLQEVQLIEGLELSYDDWQYSSRWQFGTADPGLPGTTPIIAPSQDEVALHIMKINLRGNCVDKLHFEQQQENPINQMGDSEVRPIHWTVIQPEIEVSVAGLQLYVFPNPTPDKLYVEGEGSMESKVNLVLSTIDGKQIASQQLKPTQAARATFDLSQLAAGMYMIQITPE